MSSNTFFCINFHGIDEVLIEEVPEFRQNGLDAVDGWVLKEALDRCLIILLRVETPRQGKLRRGRRMTHETCNQDFDPDVWTSGHLCCGCRSDGSRPGRRPNSSVPTSTKTAWQVCSTAADDEVVNRRIAVAARSLK
jgi:hypothetical protein